MRLTETVHNDRDNTIELQLTVDGTAIDHTIISRVVLEVDTTTLDSNTTPALFDFTDPTRLIMKLGAAGLDPGRYEARLIVYDYAHSNGIAWGSLVLVVSDAF